MTHPIPVLNAASNRGGTGYSSTPPPAPLPTVTGISPNTMTNWHDAAMALTVTGTSLTGATAVQISDGTGHWHSCSNVQVVNSTTVTCDSPEFDPTDAGIGDVRVTISGTDYDGLALFTIPAAGVISIDPTSGSILGGDAFTIDGWGFGASVTSVKFGSATATINPASDDHTVDGTTPLHLAGTVNVVVRKGGVDYTLTAAFTYA